MFGIMEHLVGSLHERVVDTKADITEIVVITCGAMIIGRGQGGTTTFIAIGHCWGLREFIQSTRLFANDGFNGVTIVNGRRSDANLADLHVTLDTATNTIFACCA
jgi:hypothetical protein